ncbi:hypothetical protein VIGAN_10191900, partial [Vigna angularis var. angularis]
HTDQEFPTLQLNSIFQLKIHKTKNFPFEIRQMDCPIIQDIFSQEKKSIMPLKEAENNTFISRNLLTITNFDEFHINQDRDLINKK